MNNSEKTFDAVIVGGGMVGAATALGLAQQGLQVALIENEEPAGFDPSAPADLRISAIGCASVRFLQKLGAWGAVEKMRSVPYRRLETWEVDGSEVKFDAQSLGLPELGFMVENRVLQLALWQQFDALTSLTRFCPAKLRHLLQHDDDSPQRIRYLKTLNMQQLTTEVMQAFPARLGTVKAISAGAFPLVRRHAQRYVLPGLALVGDAAHTINPLAGQGVNLGYRDVEALLSVLEKARDHDEAWSSEKVLLRYQRQRRLDNLLMQSGMDLFYTAFSNDLAPVKALRNLALMTAQRTGALKTKALKYALGI